MDLLTYISAEMSKIQLAKMAEAKARSMIAKAIAKSEIILTDGHERVTDELYYRLNIRPNSNQSGTEFWYNAANRLLETGECIIAEVAEQFYIVKNYIATSVIVFPKLYSNITVTDGKDDFTLSRSIIASDLLIMRYETPGIRLYRSNALEMENNVLQAVINLTQIANTPLFKYKYSGSNVFMKKLPDGTEKRLVIDEVIKDIAAKLTSKELTILSEATGVELSRFDLTGKTGATDVKALTDTIFSTAAILYDIPASAYSGTITEKSDATNEFITYAASPVAEVMSDALNAFIVGKDDYIKGERAYVWLGKFKHIDVVDAAGSLDKLRSDGWSLDEIRELVDYPALNTEFSQARALTKNYETEGGQTDGD